MDMAMVNIIINNPFRILGVYANASKKDIVANQGKMKAFLKVGKSVDFPTDFSNLIPPLVRTEEVVADADSKLTLSKERIKYAQFWFLKDSPIDEVAFNHLSNGDIDTAIDIWSKKDNVSSLQNRLVCYLIKEQYDKALQAANKLYEPINNLPNPLATELAQIVLGDANTSGEGLDKVFIKSITTELGATRTLQLLPAGKLKQQVAELSVKPIVEKIKSAINLADQSKDKGCTARYDAGVKLMNDTKPLIEQLKQLLPTSDTQYQMIADKLGLTILQCGIDFYNKSTAANAAHKAMRLQKYAQSIVVGQMAKDRCTENVKILNDIIDNLPPEEVYSEDKEIKKELSNYCKLPDKTEHAITLLNNTKPILMRIKSKLGCSNAYYLKISTTVVGNAMHNIIEEVNKSQQRATSTLRNYVSDSSDKLFALIELKSVMDEAWKATQIMDGFDMESDFKINRYNPNRKILLDLCKQICPDVLTGSRSTTSPSFTPSSSSTIRSTTSSSSSSSDDTNWGCIIAIIIAIIIAVLIGLISTCS